MPLLNTRDPDTPDEYDPPLPMLTSPVALFDVPLLSTTDPLVPPVAPPVVTVIDPVSPAVVVPLLNTTNPDTPDVPPFADRTVTAPELDVVPAPLTTLTDPPVDP